MSITDRLSRRERQIMEVVWAAGRASVADVVAALPDPPGYNSVRKLLTILEAKGHLAHRVEAGRYVYVSIQPAQSAAESALARVVGTFFGGSVERAVATLLATDDAHLSDEELARLSALIESARKETRR